MRFYTMICDDIVRNLRESCLIFEKLFRIYVFDLYVETTWRSFFLLIFPNIFDRKSEDILIFDRIRDDILMETFIE